VDLLTLIPVAVSGYLLGSIPMGVILARLFRWDDPRHHGSGHTGAMNVSRRAGKWGLVIVLLADLAKGVGAVWLAPRLSDNPWAITVAGIMAVVGHCWPVWLQFKGGMGLATGMGAVGFVAPLMVLIAAVLLAFLRFIVIKHTPRAVVIASLAVVPVAYVMKYPSPVVMLTTFVCIVIAYRHTTDWNRVYN
jgi:glycerol-3-phosphate acyltransferase PlsY